MEQASLNSYLVFANREGKLLAVKMIDQSGSAKLLSDIITAHTRRAGHISTRCAFVTRRRYAKGAFLDKC
jgi:hypothetical protein